MTPTLDVLIQIHKNPITNFTNYIKVHRKKKKKKNKKKKEKKINAISWFGT